MIMSKEVILKNGTIAIEAEYKEQIIEEFNFHLRGLNPPALDGISF